MKLSLFQNVSVSLFFPVALEMLTLPVSVIVKVNVGLMAGLSVLCTVQFSLALIVLASSVLKTNL